MRIAAPLAARRGTPNSTFSVPVTPGWTRAKLYGFLATSGRFCTSVSLIVWPMSMRPRSRAGMSAALTLTVSVSPPTASTGLMTTDWPTDRRTPVCSNFLKPWSSAVTV